jgi:hypothetical protein
MLMALGVFAGVVLLVVGFIVWRLVATVTATNRVYRQALARVAPVSEALARGESPRPEDLERSASAADSRKALYDVLARAERLALFPPAYRTWEKMAEADLVLWLCHPNELATAPGAIELMARLPAPQQADGLGREYFLFRFRTLPPHWAAGDGWMAGVAGPYVSSNDPAPHASGTFSRFEAYDAHSPEEHVRRAIEAAGGVSGAEGRAGNPA